MTNQLATARGQVFTMASAKHPQFRFEWHPGVSIVYVIRKGVTPEIGEQVSTHVFEQEQARTCVLAWCNGYDAGAAKLLGPQLKFS